MSNRNGLLALVLALILACAIVAGGVAEETFERAEGALVVATTGTFDQTFSPFYFENASDGSVVNLVCASSAKLVVADRTGVIITDGIDGQKASCNGSEYEYSCIGSVDVVLNDDGSADYNLTMRDDIAFSDGEPATIDDVIFDIYVLCDPTYNGPIGLNTMPIEGLEAYQSGMDTLFNLLVAAGRDNADFTHWDEATQKAFWADLDQAGEAFAQEIVDYCKTGGYNSEDDSVAACAANWGFGLEEDATAADFFAVMAETYEWDLAELSDGESAGSSLFDLMQDYEAYALGVQTGESAANIAGVARTGDYSMTLHATSFDARDILMLDFPVAPLHYYGDKALYDFENDSFGFVKGDLSGVRSKSAAPLGAGAYTFEGCSNGVVTLKANPAFYKGEPKIPVIQIVEIPESECVPGIVSGQIDVCSPNVNPRVNPRLPKAIGKANGNGELVGDVVTTVLMDDYGYGFVGINADLVNVGGKPASDASKALRKGFMTLFAAYRESAVESYFGQLGSVIQYPVSNTSWAAPRPSDPGYRDAYSVDVDGNPIYDDSMTPEQRVEAARQAAIGYFKAAGFTFDEASGKFTDAKDTYEILINGDGEKNHAAFGVAEPAAKALGKLGITLKVTDVGASAWSSALDANAAMMWAGRWNALYDPDLGGCYSSENAHGKGKNTNHYQVDDAEIDALIQAGFATNDTEERRSSCKDVMERVMDWGCVLPLYQSKNAMILSTERVNLDTVPRDMTPYWALDAEIEKLSMK